MRLNCVGAAAVALTALAAGLGAAAPMEGNPKNGLSSAAFRRNTLTTNKASLESLLTHPIKLAPGDTLFSNDLETRKQLHDPRARAMMEEIVKCALSSASTVSYEDPRDSNKKYTWSGELALCDPKVPDPSDGDVPLWAAGGPNLACQQVLTACVMARVNALGKAIPLALRGPSSTLFPAHATVSTEKRFRESRPDQDPAEGTLVLSFTGPLCLQGHECNWQPAFVGKCEGGQVKLAISDPARCASTPVRVCAGIHGCYAPGGIDKPPLDFPSASPDQYVKFLVEKTGACAGSPIAFSCPTALPLGGFYSVMTRPAPLQGGGIQPVHPPSPPLQKTFGQGVYPAPEAEVFSFREGAFYGNLFVPEELLWNCVIDDQGIRVCTPSSVVGGAPEKCVARPEPTAGVAGLPPCAESRTVPYPDVYACYSLAQQQDSQGTGSDDEGVAFMNSRICNEPNPDATCFFHKPVRCHYADPAQNANLGAHCDWLGDKGAYDKCKSLDGDPVISYHPVTTYLNDPCDLLGHHNGVCLAVLASLARGGGDRDADAPGRVGPGARGCGCDAGSGAVAPGTLAALVALAMHRRRRRR
jgi:hypothetical protein